MLLFKGRDAADARTEQYGKALCLHRAFDPAFLCRLLRRRHRKLRVTVGAQRLIYFHIFFRVKAVNLRRQLCLEIFRIKKGDRTDAASAAFQPLPRLRCVVSQWGNRPDPGHDRSSLFSHFLSPHIASPPSTRSTSPVT